MKMYLILAALAAVTSQPASAQAPAQGGAPPSPAQEIDGLAGQIDRDVAKGTIASADARLLRGEVAALRRLHDRYRSYDRTTREHTELMRRIDGLRNGVHAAEQRRLAGLRPVSRSSPFERDGPPFADVGRPNRLDDGFDSTSRRYGDSGLLPDDGKDMNDLRGPAPSKRDEDRYGRPFGN